MRKLFTMLALCAALVTLSGRADAGIQKSPDSWPDGTPIPEWFADTAPTDISVLGRQYRLTDFRIFPDGRLHTAEIQALIEKAARNGGGVIVVPPGTFLTGGLHFRQGTHLHLEAGATLFGSDFIGDYPLGTTRIEGQTCTYFGALINADGLDGFTITGEGTIDGNGLRYHRQFWLRRKWNPQCTNKDEQRPRLVYVSNCRNVRLEGVNFQNSAYWTSHFFNCEDVKILGCRFTSLNSPSDVKAPSTDAIDLDVVRNVLVKDCYISVNDDAVVLKGGKGPYADAYKKAYPGVEIPAECAGNGSNENVLVEDCEFGFCHGCLTLGSESVHDRNVILRRICITGQALNLLWLKCRPDTPQTYEYVTVEDVTGKVKNFLNVYAWTQFYDLQGRPDSPMSTASRITMRRCSVDCDIFFNAKRMDEVYELSDFVFEDISVKAGDRSFDHSFVKNFKVKNLEFR